MKIVAYTIAKNEVHNVEEWVKSITDDVDDLFVLDTGSTDGTQKELRSWGVDVKQAHLVPFRYDDAFNTALSMAPDCDVLLRLDMDERMSPGWRHEAEKLFASGANRLRYQYVWRTEENGGHVQFQMDKHLHQRHGYRNAGATHELLYRWDGGSDVVMDSGIVITHHRKYFGVKENDLELLRIDYRERKDERLTFYLGRELYRHGHYAEAIGVLREVISHPKASMTERAYSHVYISWMLPHRAEEELLAAKKITPWYRDIWFHLGRAYEHSGLRDEAIEAYRTALSLPRVDCYLNDSFVENGHLAELVQNWR